MSRYNHLPWYMIECSDEIFYMYVRHILEIKENIPPIKFNELVLELSDCYTYRLKNMLSMGNIRKLNDDLLTKLGCLNTK